MSESSRTIGRLNPKLATIPGAVDIPCVRGPEVAVNARLTLLRSEVRIKPYLSGEYPRKEGLEAANDDRFRDDMGGVEHIVTSTGVISTWQIDLPLETNQFDHAFISDVKLRILYTDRDGGDAARTAALATRKRSLKNQERQVLLPLASMFSNAWAGFTNGADTNRVPELELREELLPYEFQHKEDSVDISLSFYFEASEINPVFFEIY